MTEPGADVGPASMYGVYALPVTAPARDDCDVCGAPGEYALVEAGTTERVWCGPDCEAGLQARDLQVSEEVLVWDGRFPEVGRWPVPHLPELQWTAIMRGVAHRAVVTTVADTEVVLSNPKAAGQDGAGEEVRGSEVPPLDPSELLRLPADFPCTRWTGITRPSPSAPRPGLLLQRWPVDAPWVREVTFGEWVSYQPQGTCEDGEGCTEPASLWVSYQPGWTTATDGPSCERCLARRRRRGAAGRHRGAHAAPVPAPVPVAFWNAALDAWDVRPNDGSAAVLA
jgi:hypothetical protein